MLSSVLGLETRTFTSSDGKKLEAELVKATDKEATLKRKGDGKEFVIPLDRLSEDDRKYIATHLAGQAANTRAAREIELSVAKGKTEKMKVPEGPYLSADGTLTLYPGDEVHLEFSADGKPSIVAEVTKPERTLSLAMSNEEGMTLLSRTTKMEPAVAMDCTHRAAGSEKFARTNLHPTEKGLGGFDSWPGTVWTLRLSNFEVTDRPADEVYMERVNKK
jgi:hypothetical protein